MKFLTEFQQALRDNVPLDDFNAEQMHQAVAYIGFLHSNLPRMMARLNDETKESNLMRLLWGATAMFIEELMERQRNGTSPLPFPEREESWKFLKRMALGNTDEETK